MHVTRYKGILSPNTFVNMLDKVSEVRKTRHYRTGYHDVVLWKDIIDKNLPSYTAVCGDEAVQFIFSLCKHSEAGCSNVLLSRYEFSDYLVHSHFVVVRNKRIPEFYILLYDGEYIPMYSSMGKVQVFQKYNLKNVYKINFTQAEWSMFLLLHSETKYSPPSGGIYTSYDVTQENKVLSIV